MTAEHVHGQAPTQEGERQVNDSMQNVDLSSHSNRHVVTPMAVSKGVSVNSSARTPDWMRRLILSLVVVSCLVVAVCVCRVMFFIAVMTHASWTDYFGDPGSQHLTQLVWNLRPWIEWFHLPWTIFGVIMILKKRICSSSWLAVYVATLALALVFLVSVTIVGAAMPFIPLVTTPQSSW